MALHDYRHMIDVYDGGYVAVEITTNDKIRLHVEDAGNEWAAIEIDKSTAGVLLDHLAGAIKILEGLA